ncbi:hypothetical protein OC846_003369 [Tilletia horrida]|uniref:CMP/dCMP-type deaminase domain-containing protein n=1 Tax=Tilletia horrida TaxID=155126 RepID=A0AAN6GQ98_9BASI|nr:hypothetical protein OC846_003369 [Tilletia horrida]
MANQADVSPEQERIHYRHMVHALQLADKCVPTTTAFCVGCTIYTNSLASSSPRLISTGFSRELPGNTHAEQCALDKIVAERVAPASSLPKGIETAGDELLLLDLYTTMEPCSKRASDPQGCAQRIINFNVACHRSAPDGYKVMRISRVFQGVREPADFQLCEGQRLLRDAWVEVHTALPPAEEGSDGAKPDRDWLEKECLRIAKKSHADEPACPEPEVEELWKRPQRSA